LSKRDIKLFLKDILAAIDKTQRFVTGKTFDDFEHDDLLIDGVTRNLEVIGEAAKQIPNEFRSNRKEINWTRIVGFRNIAIHEYFEVDIEIVWTIASKQLDPLKKSIEHMLKEMEKK
jgi:uncharacterized protein with HEPN domain